MAFCCVLNEVDFLKSTIHFPSGEIKRVFGFPFEYLVSEVPTS